MIAAELKTLMTSNGGTLSERAIAVLVAAGITCSREIAEALGITVRAVQMARQRSQLREAGCAPEACCAKPASPPQQASPKSEAGFAASETGFVDQTTETRARAYKESTIVDSYSLCDGERESRNEARRSGKVIVGHEAIYGPTFVLDFAAIDMAATLIPFDKTKARQIAEVCARDWVANGTVPQQPMAMAKAAILSQHRGDEVHSVRLAQAGTTLPGFQKSKPSAKAEMLGIFRPAEGSAA